MGRPTLKEDEKSKRINRHVTIDEDVQKIKETKSPHESWSVFFNRMTRENNKNPYDMDFMMGSERS